MEAPQSRLQYKLIEQLKLPFTFNPSLEQHIIAIMPMRKFYEVSAPSRIKYPKSAVDGWYVDGGFCGGVDGGEGWRENRKSAGRLPGYPGCSGQVLQSSIPYRKINSLICLVKMLRAHLISHHYLWNHLPH